jgi:hypothetical protein
MMTANRESPIRMIRPLRVGDIVRVGRPVLDAPANSLAVVVEVYDRRTMGATGFGVTLLFHSGTFDGFSPDDLQTCLVERVAHHPALAGYAWTTAMRLIADWADGRFDAVWINEA